LGLIRLLIPESQDQDHLLAITVDLQWLVLVDVPEIRLLENLLERALNLLVVLSSPVALEGLVEHFEDSRPAGLGLCSQLLGAEVEEVCWYRYNDSRQDGRLPPQQLQSRFPNLRLEGLEARPVGRIDALVKGWLAGLGPDQGRGGLVVRDGELLPILRGATTLLPALSLVAWWQGPAALAAPDLEAIGELLEPHALVERGAPEAGISLWQRDEELFLRNALRQLTDRAEALKAANAVLLEEKGMLEARLEPLEPLPAQLEQLAAEHRALLEEKVVLEARLEPLEPLPAQLEQLAAEHRALLEEKVVLEARLEPLEPLPAQLERLAAEHRALLEEKVVLEARLEPLEPLPAQLEQLAAEHRALLEEKGMLEARLEPLEPLPAQLEQLAAEHRALLEEKVVLEARLEPLEPLPAQLEQLAAEHRALLQRQQITASALQILEQERVDSTRQLEHWRREWDQVQAEGARLRHQEVQLHGAIRAAQAEAEQWRVRFEGCQREVKALGEQLNDLRRALDAGDGGGETTQDLKQQLLERLSAGRLDVDRLAAERDQLAAERDQIAAERTTAVQHLEDLQRQKQALLEQMQQLADKVSRSESELEILKTMLLADALPSSAGALA